MFNPMKFGATRGRYNGGRGPLPLIGNVPAADVRTRWIRKLQRLYGVDKTDAESVVDDVLKVMTFIR